MSGGSAAGHRGRSMARRSSGETVEPDRAADGGNRGGRAQRLQQPVVAAAADDGALPSGARAIADLEDRAGVVVEVAAEGGREGERGDVDAARGDEAGARVEGVERRGEIEPRFRRERAQLRRGGVGIAGDGDDSAPARAAPRRGCRHRPRPRPGRGSARRSRRRCARRPTRCRRSSAGPRRRRAAACGSCPCERAQQAGMLAGAGVAVRRGRRWRRRRACPARRRA